MTQNEKTFVILKIPNILIFTLTLPMITFPSLVPLFPTLPTTNRNTPETDLVGEDALHRYDGPAEYLWA